MAKATPRRAVGLLDACGDERLLAFRPHPAQGLLLLRIEENQLVVAAAGRVRLALAPLKAMFAQAVEDGDLTANPAAVRGLDKRDDPREGEKAKALTEEEAARLLSEIEEQWQLLVRFLIESGLRISEALALRWADVDRGRLSGEGQAASLPRRVRRAEDEARAA